jgi:hypothetical protein
MTGTESVETKPFGPVHRYSYAPASGGNNVIAKVRLWVLSAQTPAVLLRPVIPGGSSAVTMVLDIAVHPFDEIAVTV